MYVKNIIIITKMELFIEQISTKYNLKDDLLTEWKQFDENYKKLNKMKKIELVDECNKHGYDNKGAKDVLIRNIINNVLLVDVIKKEDKKKDDKKHIEQKMIDSIKKNTPSVVVKRNAHGNYEHPDTLLVFDRESKIVIGKQCNQTGSILSLTVDDINNCKKFQFDYECPVNLNVNSSNGEVHDLAGDKNFIDETQLLALDEDSSEDEIEY